MLQALVEADTVRIDVDNAHNDRVTSWRKLAAVVGIPDMQPKNLAGNYSETLPAMTWENVLQELLAVSPEIAASMANLERARWQLSRAHAGRIPDVDVEGNVKYDNGAGETLVGVRVGVPLMLFNRNQGNIQRAHAEVTVAARALERLELDLQRRLAIVFNRYEKARQQVQRYAQNILPNAREAQQLVQNGYQDGEFDYLAVLTAQRTYVRANLAYLDALRQAQENRVAIQGQLLTGSLQIRP